MMLIEALFSVDNKAETMERSWPSHILCCVGDFLNSVMRFAADDAQSRACHNVADNRCVRMAWEWFWVGVTRKGTWEWGVSTPEVYKNMF